MAECMICLQQLRPPVKVLPCCHSFCHDCLRNLRNRCGIFNFDDGTISVNCPNCRQEARLDKGKVSTLPTNFALNKLLESRGPVATVTTVTDDMSRNGQRVQQSVTSLANGEQDETSSAFYERFLAEQIWHDETAQRDHEFLHSEGQSTSTFRTMAVWSIVHDDYVLIAPNAEPAEPLEEEEGHQPGYWGERQNNDYGFFSHEVPCESVVNPVDSLYLDENLQFERSIQNQQIQPAVNNEPFDVYSVVTFPILSDEFSQPNHENFSPQPSSYSSPLSRRTRRAERERNSNSFRSLSDKARYLSFLLEKLRLRIEQMYDNAIAVAEEALFVTDPVTTSEMDESFDGAVTISTSTTLHSGTDEFTDLATDHDSATTMSTSYESY